MFIKIYAVIFILTYESLAYEKESMKVGTVLFTVSDLEKPCWSKLELGLLRARRAFQNLLPPPLSMNALNENSLDQLCSYFTDAFAATKQEAVDSDTGHTMTTALADTIGGYLKVWVLPATKFGYYGGTISDDNVYRLNGLYDEIKKYLDTDGEGWRTPDTNLLDLFQVNMLNFKNSSNENIKLEDPCSHLTFFEKTPDGLNVPIPRVNWEGKSSKLFLPLKNGTIFAMNSTKSSKALVKYYDTAKYCLQTRYPARLKQFEDRFQTWLSDDVIPHLSDDHVYFALGSVLTLVDGRRNVYQDALDTCEKKWKSFGEMLHLPINLNSRKVMFVILLVFLELFWCLVVLLFTWYSRNKKKKDRTSNVYLYIESQNRQNRSKGDTDEASSHKTFEMKDVFNVASKSNQTRGKTKVEVETLFKCRRCINQECKCREPPSYVETDSFIIETKSRNIPKERLKTDHKTTMNKISLLSETVTAACSVSNAAFPMAKQKSVNTVKRSNLDVDQYINRRSERTFYKKERRVRRTDSQNAGYLADAQCLKVAKAINSPVPKKEEKATTILEKVLTYSKSDVFGDLPKSKQGEAVNRSIHNITYPNQRISSSIEASKPELNIKLSQNLNTACQKMLSDHIKHPFQIGKAIDSTSPIKNILANLFDVPRSRDRVTTNCVKSKSILQKQSSKKLKPHDTPNEMEQITLESSEATIHIDELIDRIESKQRENFTTVPQSNIDKSPDMEYHKVDPRPSDLIGERCASTGEANHGKFEFIKDTDLNTKKRSKKRIEILEPNQKGPISPSYSCTQCLTDPPTSERSTSIRDNHSAIIMLQSKHELCERKSTSSIIQRDRKSSKKSYWEIIIDEPEKDVYVDIKGKFQCDVMKPSRIPKRSTKTMVEIRNAAGVSKPASANKGKSLIPQLKKKAIDDLMLDVSGTKRNKLNTTF